MIKYLKKMELFRRLWHFLTGALISISYFYDFISREQLIFSLSGVFLFVILIESLRSENKQLNRICKKTFNLIIRKREVKGISGIPFYLIGCLFVIVLFNKTIALLSMSYLAVGDPTAGFFGKMFGRHSFYFKNGKSLIGFLAAFFVCSLITYGYCFISEIFSSRIELFIFSILAGFAAAFSELISFIDDNFSIPFISSIILYIILLFWGTEERLILLF